MAMAAAVVVVGGRAVGAGGLLLVVLLLVLVVCGGVEGCVIAFVGPEEKKKDGEAQLDDGFDYRKLGIKRLVPLLRSRLHCYGTATYESLLSLVSA